MHTAPAAATPLSPAQARELFPALRRFTWLNAAASSPLPTPVHAALTTFLDEALTQGDVAFGQWLQFREGVRARLAAFLGATARGLALVPSTSFAFNMVAQALRARGIGEVLTLEREFPSTTLPLLHHGLTLRVVRERPDGTYPLEDVEAALGPSTGAIALSLVQYASGFRVDVEGLAALARGRGLPLCLNAAQAVGHVPVRAQAWDASFVAGPSHKWLAAGYGQAFLWLREDWLGLPSPLAGWLSVEPVDLWHPFTAGATRRDDARGATVTGARFRADASRLEVGGTAFLLPYALDAALALHEGLTAQATLRHVQQLQALLRKGLARRGFVATAPEGPTTSAGLCVVRVEGSPDDAVRALFREDVATTARGGGLRLSTHVYNDESDVDRLLWAVDRAGLRPAAGGGGP